MVVVTKDNIVQIERLEMPPFGTNAYIVTCQGTQDSALIDAPAQASTHGQTERYQSQIYIIDP